MPLAYIHIHSGKLEATQSLNIFCTSTLIHPSVGCRIRNGKCHVCISGTWIESQIAMKCSHFQRNKVTVATDQTSNIQDEINDDRNVAQLNYKIWAYIWFDIRWRLRRWRRRRKRQPMFNTSSEPNVLLSYGNPMKSNQKFNRTDPIRSDPSRVEPNGFRLDFT